jgi:hypothetical protein
MQDAVSNSGPPTPPRAGARRGSIFTREPVLLLGVLLATFYFGRPILIPMALALTFAFLLTPLVTRVERMRFRRTPAALLVLCAATALLAGILWLVAGQLLTVVNGLPSHEDNIRAKLASTHIPADSSLGHALVNLEGLSRELSIGQDDTSAAKAALPAQPIAPIPREPRSRSARERQSRAAQAQAAAAQADQTPPDSVAPLPVVVVQPQATDLYGLPADQAGGSAQQASVAGRHRAFEPGFTCAR